MTNIIDAPNTAPTGAFKVDPFRGTSSGEVSMQWMRRPHDQRYLNLDDMEAAKRTFYTGSWQVRGKTSEVELIAPDLGSATDIHKLKVGVVGTVDDRQVVHEVAPTNWAFGQLCTLGKSPATFMRELPSPLVADVLGYRLRFAREVEAIKFYGNSEQLHSATGPDYGRIPDYEVIRAVQQVAGSGRGEMRWKIPGVMNWENLTYNPDAPVTLDSTTLYASDRDMFVFLVDDRNPIEIGKLPDGSPDLVFRGFYLQNSEVGKASLKLAAFLLRGVCMNRCLWGIEGFQEIRIAHNATAPDRWLHQCEPALKSYANGSSQKLIDGVNAAKAATIASDQEAAMSFLKARKFSFAAAKEILEQGEREEGRPVRSAWDFAQAITAHARALPNTDTRLDQERVAGDILDAVH